MPGPDLRMIATVNVGNEKRSVSLYIGGALPNTRMAALVQKLIIQPGKDEEMV
jgi:hypothetical protein